MNSTLVLKINESEIKKFGKRHYVLTAPILSFDRIKFYSYRFSSLQQIWEFLNQRKNLEISKEAIKDNKISRETIKKFKLMFDEILDGMKELKLIINN